MLQKKHQHPLPIHAKKKPLLLIGGRDSQKLSGLDIDIQVASSMGVDMYAIETFDSMQSASGVKSIKVKGRDAFKKSLKQVPFSPHECVVKVGALGDHAFLKDIVESFERATIVLDPVLGASNGGAFVDLASFVGLLKKVENKISWITPNIDEWHAISKQEGLEFKHVLLKGGHGLNPGELIWFKANNMFLKLNNEELMIENAKLNVRGTGCGFASFLACGLALGFEELDAVVLAKSKIHQGMRLSEKQDDGQYKLHVSQNMLEADDLCHIETTSDAFFESEKLSDVGSDENLNSVMRSSSMRSDQGGLYQKSGGVLKKLRRVFFGEAQRRDDLAFGLRKRDLNSHQTLRLYPIFNRAHWLSCNGFDMAQLRIKDLEGKALEQEIQKGIALAKDKNIRLYINDEWKLAIKLGGYGAHLGQEDLDALSAEDLKQIASQGLKLGISTHGYFEAARAKSLNPSYVALGPIFETQLKKMNVQPQGVQVLKQWRQLFPNIPLVAIGGITIENTSTDVTRYADYISMVRDITLHPNPQTRINQWNEKLKSTK